MLSAFARREPSVFHELLENKEKREREREKVVFKVGAKYYLSVIYLPYYGGLTLKGAFPQWLFSLIPFKVTRCFLTPAGEGTSNTSPAISDTLFKSSFIFYFLVSKRNNIFFFLRRFLPLVSTRLFPSSAIITREPIVSRSCSSSTRRFIPFFCCCVVHTNCCNGGGGPG